MTTRRGRRRAGRDINGILLLDKPAGMTSNAALQAVKGLLRARKAGHTGSLDPLATGMLPICLGEATKVSGFMLEADKHYRTAIRLGVRTVSGDADGAEIYRRDCSKISEKQIDDALEGFRGEIEQVPPMHSAIKQNGTPLYKLAHQGIEVERAARKVRIHRLECLGLKEGLLELFVHCSKGTYIRSLADDLGERLGCGAHVERLRRVGVGALSEGDMVSLAHLTELAEAGLDAADAQLLSMETALAQWPDVRLNSEIAYFLKRGQAVFVPHAPRQGWVRIYAGDDRFLGVGQILDDGRVAPKRLLNG